MIVTQFRLVYLKTKLFQIRNLALQMLVLLKLKGLIVIVIPVLPYNVFLNPVSKGRSLGGGRSNGDGRSIRENICI